MRYLIYLLAASALTASDADFNGRWVIENSDPSAKRVLWLEVKGAETDRITGSAVGMAPGGQVDEIVDAVVEGGELSFHIDRYTGRGDERRFVRALTTARLAGDTLQGSTMSDGRLTEWTGRRAPQIEDRDDGGWKRGDPVVLMDGTSIDAWTTLDPSRLANDWRVLGGVLENAPGADVLSTKDKFWNFELHVEFRVHEGSNGGIALRGRYEIQILDDYGRPPSKSGAGALYSRVPPLTNASLPSTEWQRFHIRLIGRDLTVRLNGELIHDKVTVEGFTAMASDWREGEPGPITLQGDHGLVEFRKIVLTPLTR